MKKFLVVLAIHMVALTSAGCVVKEWGQTIEQTVKGDYFLESDQSRRGRESFRREVEENPDSPLANYYYGRFLLQEKENKKALEHLRKAADLQPGNADYQFWAGLAYGVNGMVTEEEQRYKLALEIDGDHLQALIYLGHRRLARKQYKEALELYSRALDIWPGSPSALYNRALILNRLDRTPEERLAWLFYLNEHPSGSMAAQATEYLNLTEDYSFRNHDIGGSTVTVEQIRFIPFTAVLDGSSYDSLHLVGEVFAGKKGTLQVLVYLKNNKELAHERAVAIKTFLLDEIPAISSKQIGISWFSEPQILTVRGKRLTLDESVSFFISAK